MAKNLMAGHGRPRRTERGLSIIEVLVATVILGIGLLGLILLQVMAVRGAGNGKGLQTAILVGESIMDRIEMEGRLSWLNLTNTSYSTVQPLTNLTFLDPTKPPPTLAFTMNGSIPDLAAKHQFGQGTFYTATTTRTLITSLATGKISECTVVISFPDANQPSTAPGSPTTPIYRTFRLTRRIRHA